LTSRRRAADSGVVGAEPSAAGVGAPDGTEDAVLLGMALEVGAPLDTAPELGSVGVVPSVAGVVEPEAGGVEPEGVGAGAEDAEAVLDADGVAEGVADAEASAPDGVGVGAALEAASAPLGVADGAALLPLGVGAAAASTDCDTDGLGTGAISTGATGATGGTGATGVGLIVWVVALEIVVAKSGLTWGAAAASAGVS